MERHADWIRPVVLSSAHFTQHFYDRVLPPLIPVLALQFGLPFWKLGLLVTAHTLGAGAFQAPVGHLADRMDRRLFLPSGAALLALGYIGFVYADPIGVVLPAVVVGANSFDGPFVVMIVTMFLGGIGASIAHPVGYPLITANVSPERKGRALGLWSSSSKLGDAVAAGSVGLLLLTLRWDAILLLLSALGLVYAVVLYVALGWFDTAPPAIDRSEESTAETSIWQGDRRRYVYPMLAILVLFVVRTFAAQGVYTFTPAFITDVYGYSLSVLQWTVPPESLANIYFMILFLTAAAAQLVTGSLAELFDHRKMLFVFVVAAAVSLAVLATVHLSPSMLFLVVLVVGASLWGSDPARDLLVSDVSPADMEGRTFGYLWTVTQLLGAFSATIIGYVADSVGIQNSFGLVAAVLFVGGVAILPLFSTSFYLRSDPDIGAASSKERG